MMNLDMFKSSVDMPYNLALLLPILFLVDLVLRGIALWRAGRNNQLPWFFALFIVNSLGILPAIYLIFFDKGRKAARGTKNKKLI